MVTFSKKQLDAINKDSTLKLNYERVVGIIDSSTDTSVSAISTDMPNSIIDLLYTLIRTCSKVSTSNLETVIKNIVNGNLDCKERVDEAVKYCLDTDAETFGVGSMLKRCEVGVTYDKDTILVGLNELFSQNKLYFNEKQWGGWGEFMKNGVEKFKFADKRLLKETVDTFFESKFGSRKEWSDRRSDLRSVQKSDQRPDQKSIQESNQNSNNTTNTTNLNFGCQHLKQKDDRLLEEHFKRVGDLIKVVTRFPPEPNGYLHIGHVKAIYINFTYAQQESGRCYLRFDDTNPEKEKQEYIDAILEDVNWLGHNPYKITYTSDYFDQLYDLCEELIKRDKAYVCELDADKIKDDRLNKVESPFRNRPIEESLKMFQDMSRGKYAEKECVVRMKGDMQSDNPNMRDLTAFRIIYREHPKSGDKWCIYPSYDFSHCIVDSLEDITHSLCTMEFQTRNESYRWLLDALDMYKPTQIEYSRLHLTHCMLSKRKLIQLVEDDYVDGWDDPRLPTLRGLRRRGYPPDAINEFCKKIGVSVGTSDGVVRYEVLEECVRQNLNLNAPRIMGTFDPVKIFILNWTDIYNSDTISVDVPDFPNKKDSTTHKIAVNETVWIDRSDFREVDNPDYYGLAPNKVVRLKYFGIIKCVNYDKYGDQNAIDVYCTLLPDYDGKVKGTISWVSDINKVDVEIREYDHLLPKSLNDDKDWLEQINKDSKKVRTALVDSHIKNGKNTDNQVYQFERIGYFCVDPDTNKDKIVLNSTVSLKESKDKQRIN
jgi:glutaminyl-tRNA synthetase